MSSFQIVRLRRQVRGKAVVSHGGFYELVCLSLLHTGLNTQKACSQAPYVDSQCLI